MAKPVYTPQEMQRKINKLSPKIQLALVPAMLQAALNCEGESKKYCTPGRSPYYKAPYTQDNDPRREPPHMRDVMYTDVSHDGEKIVAKLGNPKHYALAVHDGTSRMKARPFIKDAIEAKEDETVEFVMNAVSKLLRSECV